MYAFILIFLVVTIFTSFLVPLIENVNGKLLFYPGDTVLNGTKVTIRCVGIDLAEAPTRFIINKIRIWKGKTRLLRVCPGVFDVGRECHYNIIATKSLSYYCQFHTDTNKRACFTSQKLTVTEDSKEMF